MRLALLAAVLAWAVAHVGSGHWWGTGWIGADPVLACWDMTVWLAGALVGAGWRKFWCARWRA